MIWCHCLKKIEPASQLLCEAKLFIDGLSKVTELFSPILFGKISLNMINIVTICYLSVTQLMNADETMEWERQMALISYGIVALGVFWGQYQVHLLKH